MICRGCSADLSKGRNVQIKMTYGRLYLPCPLCGYESQITVDDEGKVSLVNQNDVNNTEPALDLIHEIGIQERTIKENNL